MRILALVPVVLMTACAPSDPEELTDAEREEIVQAIHARLDEWVDRMEAGSDSDFPSLWTEDARSVDFNIERVGVQEVVAQSRDLRDDFQLWEYTSDEREIDVLSPDVAVVERHFRVRRIHNDGRVQEPDILHTVVLQRVDGEWRIGHSHLSGSVQTVERLEPAETYVPPPSPEEAIAETRAALIEALATDDVPGIMAGLSPDHYTLPPDAPMPADNQELSAWHRARISDYTFEPDIREESLDIFGDVAVERWTSRSRVVPRDGGEPIVGTQKGLWIWSRQADGSWKLWLSAWNSDEPVAAVQDP